MQPIHDCYVVISRGRGAGAVPFVEVAEDQDYLTDEIIRSGETPARLNSRLRGESHSRPRFLCDYLPAPLASTSARTWANLPFFPSTRTDPNVDATRAYAG